MKNQTATTNAGREVNQVGAPPGMLVRRDNGQGFRIREEVVIIGRHYDCDIRIETPDVSRVHAVVCRKNGSLVLEDLGGKYGTRVNSVAVGWKFLRDGDRIQIGRAELIFKSV
jgi:pSer/pThr/pTyr-binding forkhead associated (FHA) protein